MERNLSSGSATSISTAFLMASVAAGFVTTARPVFAAPKYQEMRNVTPAVVPEVAVATGIRIAKLLNPAPFATLKDKAHKVLDAYTPGHVAGDTSITSEVEHIELARAIINSLPSGIPIPTMMRNDDGEIGMFWDNDDAYIDIDIDADGSLSLYSRVRSTGEENFLVDVMIEELDPSWFYTNLSALSNQSQIAA